MNRPPPEHQAFDVGVPARELLVERWLLRKQTHRPSILASSPTPTNDETESRDSDDSSDGAGQWRPWADIATPLLDVLLPRVGLLDCVLLSFVCRPWHDFLADYPSLRRPRFLWLMNRHAVESVRKFCSLSDDGYYALHLANTKNRECAAATTNGWLLFLDLRRRGMHEFGGLLVNPLSKAFIDLPICPLLLDHATLSAAPTEPSCVVLGLARASCGTWKICYCPMGQKTWHIQQEQFLLKSNIAVLGGKFYFLCEKGLAEFDLSRVHPLKWLKLNNDTLLDWNDRILNLVCVTKPFMDDLNYLWLVESNGELLIVTLMLLPDQYAPEKGGANLATYVHRADFANKIWVNVEDLGGRSLFLSKRACFSLPAADVSEDVGGCIYLSYNRTHLYKGSRHLWQECTAPSDRS